jgi:hypothetical protein
MTSNVIQFPAVLPYVVGPQDTAEQTDQLNMLIRYINTIVYGDNLSTTVLLKVNNLSDLDSVATARSNLGLGSAAVLSSTAFDAAGAAAAAQAASLQKSQNLADLTNAGSARGHLGLGSAATMSSTAFDAAGAAAARAAKGNNNDITALLDLTIATITANHSIAAGDQYLLVLATTGAKTITYKSSVSAGIVRVFKGDATYNAVNISDGSTNPPIFSLVAPANGGYCQGVTILKSTAGLKCF